MAGAGHYGEGDGNGEKSAFRWIDAARYTVAAVVLVLIVAVIVNAIKLVLRPEPLSLSIVGGTVFVRRLQPPPPPASLEFDLNLRAKNPSGRAHMYFRDIVGYLFDSNMSAAAADPGPGSFIYSPLSDMAVLPLGTMDNFAQVNGTRALMTESYFDELYNGNSSASIRGVTVRLDGVVVTEVAVKDTTRNTTYYCGPVLVVRGDPSDAAFQDTPDAPCTDQEQGGQQLGS
ncbi:unnamed protein product [Urochloa decumbens]|uniref:Late embryogenesis abundant protein LEA-2 subgroup domain-containing protein n=1 Tax=Urochloa decumbens TaxID=240449 RepID=A0ABC9DV72_9POAL